MKTRGEYIGAQRTLEGDLMVSFAVDDDLHIIEFLEANRGKEMALEVHRYSEKRSLNANAYFWKLCDKIARVLESDKDTIYLLQLSKYGVFADMDVPTDAVPLLQRQFRYVQEIDDGNGSVIVRVYFGSSTYTKEEMSILIGGTKRDAQDLGIDLDIEPNELQRLIDLWEAKV